MIRDLLQGAPAVGEIADVCVVGAGAAGISLAVELARKGKRVLLLEAGGREVEEESQQPCQGVADALPHRGLHAGRVRSLGGTTNLWGGQILELDSLDFEQRPWIPESGWPFAKDDLTPYYKRALALEGLDRSILNDAAVWAQVGEKMPEFERLHTYVSRWCREPNFAQLHAKALELDPQLEVWLHANAVELLMQDQTVVGVRCRTLTGVEAIFGARQFCFCLGAIESSRFFLQPRSGRLPWNESGLLGRHFQDHIDCDTATVVPHSATAFHGSFDAIFSAGYKYNPKVRLDQATQRSGELLNIGATFYTSSDDEETLAALKLTAKRLLRGRVGQIGAVEAWRLIRHSPKLVRQSYRYAVEHRAYHPAHAPIKMRVHCEQEPASDSRITLAETRDELGLLRTRLAWKICARELRTIREFTAIARESLKPIAKVLPDPALETGDSFIGRCEDSFHHMGGMRMHASSRQGVVDPDLKLHGTVNAFICSTAVYPTSGFSNPTHTLIALAIRLADHLTG